MATQVFKEGKSHQWHREHATVWSSQASDLFPGGLAQIIYSYSHKGRYFSGTHENNSSHILRRTGMQQVFPKESQIVVRVKPGRPKTSVLRDDDQDQVALKLKTRFE